MRSAVVNALISIGGTLLSTLFGAFFGALFGYWFALYQQKKELQARRKALLELLRSELNRIVPTLERHDAAKAFYRDPIRLNAPTRLLDGQTLEFRKHARLIQLLLNLNVAISCHNDFVQVTNLAQALYSVPDKVHAQWYRDIQQRISAVVMVRNEILEELRRIHALPK